MIKKLTGLMFALFTVLAVFGQTDENSADLMKSNGKIYVVVAVVVTILIGLFAYLINLDSKISKLEKNN